MIILIEFIVTFHDFIYQEIIEGFIILIESVVVLGCLIHIKVSGKISSNSNVCSCILVRYSPFTVTFLMHLDDLVKLRGIPLGDPTKF